MDMGIPLYPGGLISDAVRGLHDTALFETRLELAIGSEYDRTDGVLRQLVYPRAAPG